MLPRPVSVDEFLSLAPAGCGENHIDVISDPIDDQFRRFAVAPVGALCAVCPRSLECSGKPLPLVQWVSLCVHCAGYVDVLRANDDARSLIGNNVDDSSVENNRVVRRCHALIVGDFRKTFSGIFLYYLPLPSGGDKTWRWSCAKCGGNSRGWVYAETLTSMYDMTRVLK